MAAKVFPPENQPEVSLYFSEAYPKKCPPFCKKSCSKQHHELLVSILNVEQNNKLALEQFKHTAALYKGLGPAYPILDSRRDYRYPVLHWAAVLGKKCAVQYLIKQGHPPALKSYLTGETAMHRAVCCLYETMSYKEAYPADKILKRFKNFTVILGAGLFVDDDNGNTPLHTCAICISSVFEERHKISFYKTALNYMIDRVVEIEKKQKSPTSVINWQNREGDTLLHILAGYKAMDSKKVINKLLRKHANFGLKNNNGETSFDIAQTNTRQIAEMFRFARWKRDSQDESLSAYHSQSCDMSLITSPDNNLPALPSGSVSCFIECNKKRKLALMDLETKPESVFSGEIGEMMLSESDDDIYPTSSLKAMKFDTFESIAPCSTETLAASLFETVNASSPERVSPSSPEAVPTYSPETLTAQSLEAVAASSFETVTPELVPTCSSETAASSFETVTAHSPESVAAYLFETVTPGLPELVPTCSPGTAASSFEIVTTGSPEQVPTCSTETAASSFEIVTTGSPELVPTCSPETDASSFETVTPGSSELVPTCWPETDASSFETVTPGASELVPTCWPETDASSFETVTPGPSELVPTCWPERAASSFKIVTPVLLELVTTCSPETAPSLFETVAAHSPKSVAASSLETVALCSPETVAASSLLTLMFGDRPGSLAASSHEKVAASSHENVAASSPETVAVSSPETEEPSFPDTVTASSSEIVMASSYQTIDASLSETMGASSCETMGASSCETMGASPCEIVAAVSSPDTITASSSETLIASSSETATSSSETVFVNLSETELVYSSGIVDASSSEIVSAASLPVSIDSMANHDDEKNIQPNLITLLKRVGKEKLLIENAQKSKEQLIEKLGKCEQSSEELTKERETVIVLREQIEREIEILKKTWNEHSASIEMLDGKIKHENAQQMEFKNEIVVYDEILECLYS